MQIWIALFLLATVIFFYSQSATNEKAMIQTLFHQMSRWSTASTQDRNPMIRVLHANYGVGYMMALQAIAPEERIASVVGVPNIRELFAEVQKIQNEATIALARTCPAIVPQTPLAKYGSEA